MIFICICTKNLYVVLLYILQGFELEFGSAFEPLEKAIVVVPISTFKEPKQKRQTKVSHYMCSPYKTRSVVIDENLSPDEIKVSDRVFALMGDIRYEILYTYKKQKYILLHIYFNFIYILIC